ncbi:MAG: hypothetical protein M3N52_11805 [Actinomycetota bacterium]|nr:hypothetical protein [Actinomycetota bacterium]
MRTHPATLTLTDDTDTIVIRPPAAGSGDPIVCTSWDLGAPTVRDAAAPRAGADGVIDRARYIGPRTVTLDLAVFGDDAATAYDYAGRLTAMTHPTRRPKLLIERGNPEATGETWEMLLRGNPFSITYGRRAAAMLELQLTFEAPLGLLEGPLRGRESVAAESLAYTATNLIPNPSFEVDTGSWNAWGGTLDRSTAQAWRGAASGLFTASAAASAAHIGTPDTVMPATAGAPYTAQSRARMSTANARLLFPRLYFLDSAGAVLNSFNGVSVLHDQAAWRLTSVTATAPTGTAYASVYLMGGADVVAGDAVHIDGVMLDQSDRVRPYFDGATTGATWTGTVHNSPSTYTGYPAHYGVVAGDPLPWRLGNATAANPYLEFVVAGHAPVHPLVYIYGPVTDPAVEDDTGNRFVFTGLNLASGQFVDIDMAEGTVRIGGNPDASVYHLVDFTQSTFWRWMPGAHAVRYEATAGRVAVHWRERRLTI